MEESAKERKTEKIESVRGRGERAEMEAERGSRVSLRANQVSGGDRKY